MPPWAGPRAQQPTAHSHSHSLSTAMAAAPAVDLLLLLLLLVALLIIALLLLLPETHTTLECRAKGGLVRGAYLPRVDELVLPGRYPQLADRRLLNLLSYQPTVSANAPKASKVAHERVKRFWAERGRERGRVVGSKSVKEALWAQGARGESKCYLDEEKHLDSPPWLTMTKSKRNVIASGARRIDPWSSTHGSKLQPVSNNCYLVSKRGEAWRRPISCTAAALVKKWTQKIGN